METLNRKFYFIIPITAFFLILSNAIFGHMVFDDPNNQDISKYSIYVHFQEDWNSSPANLLFDITTVWSNPNPIDNPKEVYYDPGINIDEIKSRNFNELQEQHGKTFVELKHEFSNCKTSWKPDLYRYGVDSVRNQFEQDITDSNENPYTIMFPNIKNENYGNNEQKQKLSKGYSQFIPICTSKDTTTYNYSVKINDKEIGFDVYFIPSIEEQKSYVKKTGNFIHYKNEGCFGNNFLSYSNTCENVEKQSGLLIIIPDELQKSLTKIQVNLHEKS